MEKTALGDDQRRRPPARGKRSCERVQVAVLIDDRLGARQAAAVDDRRVVQRVGQDHVALAGEGGDDAGVGQEARAKQHARGVALELGQFGLELRWIVMLPDTSARRAGARAPALRRVGGGGAHRRMTGEAEVVV